MTNIFPFPDMLPEHQDALMSDLVATGSHCTAIMLASTCHRERERYARLGYKWPFAAARLSAVSNGYDDLFKYLLEYCKRDRFMDKEYNHCTLFTIGQGTNVELFKWYVGPGFYFKIDFDRLYMSWDIFVGVVAEYLTEDQLRRILSYSDLERWNLQPFYYVQKRFGALTRDTMPLREIGRCGTLTDVEQLGAGVFFDTPTGDIYPLIYAAIRANNSHLLNDVFEKWPVVVEFLLDEENRYPNNLERMLQGPYLSVSLLEVFKRHGMKFDCQAIIKVFFRMVVRQYSQTNELSSEMRALLEYGGWILPDGLETRWQVNCWLSPEDEKSVFGGMAVAIPVNSLLNAL
jgi:hypothetical protein